MAKRTAPSSLLDASQQSAPSSRPLNPLSLPAASPRSANSRITRSAAARLAAEPPRDPPPADPARTPPARPSRKRKIPRAGSSSEASSESPPTPAARQSKRPKLDPANDGLTATAQPRPRKGKGKQHTMSDPNPDETPSPTDAMPPAPPTAAKRKSGKGKKGTLEDSPAATSSTSRRSKKASRKSEDVEMPDDDSPPKSSSSKTSLKKSHRALDEEKEPAPPPPPPETDDRDEDDGMDDPFTRGLFGRGHLGGLSHTMRALAGMMSGSGTASRLREILESLRQKDDPSRQLVALNELSQLLLVSNEENLSGHFAPDHFVKELVSLMQPNEFGEENPEMMLVACRCIANLMEALPQATASVVYGGAVPILCQKLLEIHYIDLAEQALSTLERISVEFPASIVREGGLTACLTYLDFFATGTQRTAVTTAANCCRNIPEDSFPVVRDVMPILLNVLSSSDQRVVEQGSLCVSGIVESFKYQPNKLEELVSTDLLRAILRLLLPGTTNLIGPNIHTQFLRVLSITARASPTLSAELFKMDIIDTLYQILTGVSPPDDVDDMASKIDGVVIMQALIHRPREQIYETLNVVCELLPGVSTTHLIEDPAMPNFAGEGSIVPNVAKSETGNEKRIELLSGCQDKVKRFATILLPTLTHAFSSTVNLSVRQKVLTAQLKMLSNLDISILESALHSVPFSSYLSSILSQQDHPTLVWHAILAAELLLSRLEHIYGYQFYREGVMAEVKKLAERPLEKAEARDKDKESRRESTGSDPAIEKPDEPAEQKPHRDSIEEEDDTAVLEEDEDNDDDDLDDDDEDVEGDGDDDEDDDEDVDDDEIHAEIHEDVSPSPSSSSSDQRYPLHDAVSSFDNFVTQQARKLYSLLQRDQFQEGREKASSILQDIKDLAASIREEYIGTLPTNRNEVFQSLSEYFTTNTLKSMTSAELLNSNIVDVLLDVFDEDNNPSNVVARSAFIQVFMTKTLSSRTPDKTPWSPFSVLIHKLQDLLSRAEHFEVVTVHQNVFDSGRSSASAMLAKQLRLKLVADDESDIPKPYRNIMVSIHAIATFKALDDYLRPRLSLSDRPRGGRHHDSLSGSLAALAAATGLPSPHQRFLERGFFGQGDSHPSLSAPASSTAPGLPATPKQDIKKPGKDKPFTPSSNVTAPSPSPLAESKTPLGRKSKQSQTAEDNSDVPEPSGEQNDPLECADERQLTDEDEDEDDGDGETGLETFVDDLEDEIESSQAKEPSAVNMEVASTGKVTARQDDGTRIPTPAQSTGYAAPPRQRSQQSTPSGPAGRTMSYAAAIQSTPTDWHIEFSIDGEPIPNSTTIYRAVHYNKEHPGDLSTRSVWSAVHPVKFKKVAGPPPQNQAALASQQSSEGSSNVDMPASLHGRPETSKILRLLNTLHHLNENLADVLDKATLQVNVQQEPVGQFVNTKLTAKLNRQLEEPLIVASNCLPPWSEDLARLYAFLFPFETRHLFLQSTSFGYARSMTRWQSSPATSDSRRDRHDDRPFLGRLQRQKVRISRTRILESAIKVLELYGSSSSVLEVEYFEEVGTGLGPTLEFYSTVSKEFSRKKTKLWREQNYQSGDEYVFGKQGLFPAPLSESQAASDHGKKVLHLFKILGKFVARAMLDSRIIDISFNPMFFKIAMQQVSTQSSLNAVKSVDPELASSLRLIKRFVTMKQEIVASNDLSEQEKSAALQKVEFSGAKIDDLGLDFTLPGYPAIELIANGSNIPVTMENVDTYLGTVIDSTLGQGIQKQVDSFKSGFSEVFQFSALRAFTPDELVMLFGRVEEDWTLETLLDSVKADHGFNMDSKSVRNLLQTMSELDPSQRRDFLQFVTGSPKLPIGGFKSLTPMFTVVCKPSEPPYSSDDYLPSVMTCVNYLKLPDYSDLEIMRSRLFTAIKEGQGAFHLS